MVPPSLLIVALVALGGMGARLVTSSRVGVVVIQVVLLLQGTALLHGQGHLWKNLVPVPDTGAALGVLLTEAYETVTNYTAPAPANRGTILAVSLLLGLTAVAVDACAVTFRSPAAAGIPLLAAFLSSATNSGEGLGALWAIPPRSCGSPSSGGRACGRCAPGAPPRPASRAVRSPTPRPSSRRPAGSSA